MIRISLAAVALFLSAAMWLSVIHVRAAEYEFDWDEGLHQEEWYDPTDWFDSDEQIEYETDWYDNVYGYSDPIDPYEAPERPEFPDQAPDAGGTFEFGTGYDYYTRDWYRKGAFEEWYRSK